MAMPEEWLDGLEGEARTQRRLLLERLLAAGFSDAEVSRAVGENRVALLLVDRVLGASLTAREIEERTGLPAERMARSRWLQGLSAPGLDDRVFSPDDVAAAQSTKLFLQAGIDEESIDETSAVMGEGMARLAATITGQFLSTFLHAGESEEEVAERFAELAAQLAPLFTPILAASFTAQLRASVGRGVLGRAELDSGVRAAEQELAVCFADLVGFTRLGGQVEVLELGSVAGRLARLAATIVEPPVRLIKTIGDAAMFVSPDPVAMVETALAFVAAVADADLPSLRAGIAFGPAGERAGDYYGNTVNLASRVTGTARPDTVLCTREIRERAPDRFDWSSAGRHRLKGVGRSVALYRARAHRTTGSSG